MRKLLVLFLILMSATCFGATRQKTWVTGNTITANDLNADWDNFYSEKITASNINDGAVGNNQLGTITTAGKINFTALTVSGQAQGDVIYYNGTNWTRLGTGTSGQALVTGGAGANPSWGVSVPWTKSAWVAYAPATGTVADSYNVTSVTNTGVGNETINFTVAFADVNYCALVGNGQGDHSSNYGTKAVGTLQILSYSLAGAAIDSAQVSAFICGD